jgi:PAS domain S-box-containing protein
MRDPLNPLQILENIPEGVFAINRDCCITYFNQKAEEITGYDRQQALGRTCHEVFRPEICQSRCSIKESMTSGRELFDHQVNVLDRSSRPLSIRVQTSPLRDEKGDVVGGLQTFHVIDRPGEEVLRELTLFELRKKLGNNPKMARIYELLPDLADSDAPVLLQGEPGTGKRLLAGAIHKLSGRRNGPFFHVICKKKSPEDLSRELLGTLSDLEAEPRSREQGILEQAHQGTLFLEGIGALPYSLQVSLFRAMERGAFVPVGSGDSVNSDFRLIASTETGLEKKVREGTFPESLFYCLNVFKIAIPPLREHRDDLRPLARDILWRLRLEQGKDIQDLDESVARILTEYPFPGNLAELEEVLRHAYEAARFPLVRAGNLPSRLGKSGTSAGGSPAEAAQAANQELPGEEGQKILAALVRNHWNRKRAADELGMDRTTLWRKMKRMGIHHTNPSAPGGEPGGKSNEKTGPRT